MKMYPLLKYTLKVWQTAVFTTPVIFFLFTLLRSPGLAGNLSNFRLDNTLLLFVLMAIIGMILSVPSALLLWWSADLVVRHTQMDVLSKKTLLCLIGVVLAICPFLLLNYGGTLSGEDGCICLLYAMTIGVSVWLYDWEDSTPIEKEDEFALIDQ